RRLVAGAQAPLQDGPVAAGLLAHQLQLEARAAAGAHSTPGAGAGQDRLVEGHVIAFLVGNLSRARTIAGLTTQVAEPCERLKRDLVSAGKRPLSGAWWSAGVEPLEEVIADAQRVGHGGEPRVHGARGGEEAGVDHVEVVDVVRFAIEVERSEEHT